MCNLLIPKRWLLRFHAEDVHQNYISGFLPKMYVSNDAALTMAAACNPLGVYVDYVPLTISFIENTKVLQGIWELYPRNPEHNRRVRRDRTSQTIHIEVDLDQFIRQLCLVFKKSAAGTIYLLEMNKHMSDSDDDFIDELRDEWNTDTLTNTFRVVVTAMVYAKMSRSVRCSSGQQLERDFLDDSDYAFKMESFNYSPVPIQFPLIIANMIDKTESFDYTDNDGVMWHCHPAPISGVIPTRIDRQAFRKSLGKYDRMMSLLPSDRRRELSNRLSDGTAWWVLESSSEKWSLAKVYATLPPSLFKDSDILMFMILMGNDDGNADEEKKLTRNHVVGRHHGVFVGRGVQWIEN
jgi:hypothetical protein